MPPARRHLSARATHAEGWVKLSEREWVNFAERYSYVREQEALQKSQDKQQELTLT